MSTQAAQLRIKELETMIREKDIALMGLQAKNQGLQAELSATKRERGHLWQQAKTLQVIGILLNCVRGDDIIKAVPEATRRLIEEHENLARRLDAIENGPLRPSRLWT